MNRKKGMENLDKDFIDETNADITDETNAEITDETADNSKEASDPVKDNGTQESGPKMKFCTICGKRKPESARFCPECGRDRYGRSASDPVFIPGNRPAFTPPPPMMNPPYQRTITAPPQNKGIVPALIALIISLVNFFIFGSLFTFLSLPAVIVLSVIAFKRGSDGRVIAIIAIVITVISTVLFAFYIAIAVKLAPDVKYFVEHDKEIIENYEEYGEIPERYKKYQDKKYDKLWSRMGYDDFDDFFGDIVKRYNEASGKYEKNESNSGNKKDTTKKSTSPSTTEATTDFDHSGEDLVVLT